MASLTLTDLKDKAGTLKAGAVNWVSFAGTTGGLTEYVSGSGTITSGSLTINDAGISAGLKTVGLEVGGTVLGAYETVAA